MPCELCHDSHWVVEHIDGVDRARRCDCWHAAMAEQLLRQARIPKRYAHCELSNFEQATDSLREAHRCARAFVEGFPVPRKGLLLYGLHGVGKTHLAIAILKDLIRNKGARGYFYETPELLKLVRDTYAGGDATEMEVLQPVLEAEILVLDDLGAEKTSEWVQETLGLVVNARYSERRATIFTTNLVDNPDREDLNSLVARVGSRTRSRLFEMCEWVEMAGWDARDVGMNPTPEQAARYTRRPADSGRSGIPDKSRGMARASLRGRGTADLSWAGGKGGSR